MKRSAGLLMYRWAGQQLEVLLVHPGGPFWRNKHIGAWTIPKGEAQPDEDLLQRAKIEFEEELGIAAPARAFVELGTVKQKGGKIVHAWAFEGDLPRNFTVRSNTFAFRGQNFPEIDRAEFFSLEDAREKLNPAQTAFLDRLLATFDAIRQ